VQQLDPGETYRNDDGSDRQAIISRCSVGELPVLEHDHALDLK
jgi:hypothetical protein